MAYNEFLGERIGIVLRRKGVAFEEKKMMGGLAMMVDEKMCVGVIKDKLMVRIDPEIYETALTRPGCKPMDFTGKQMKGFVFVEQEVIDQEEDLEYWIALALEFNPRAKSSKKKR